MRIKFEPLGCAPVEKVRSQIQQNSGLPRAQRGEHEHPVAVVGGGHSLTEHLAELRRWPGDIWAINSTADWLLGQGIDCTLISLDPSPLKTTAAKLLLASCCEHKPHALIWEMAEHHEGGVLGGVTTACRAASLALRLGYPGAVFFGCEGSFPQDSTTHVNKDDGLKTLLIVRAGQDYCTHPELYMQCESLSQLIREFPVFEERCGGLLRGMVEHPDWEIVAVSSDLREHLKEHNGADLWDGAYQSPEKE
jgi:hypothetical protein